MRIADKENLLMSRILERLMEITSNPDIKLSDEELQEKVEEVNEIYQAYLKFKEKA